MFYWPSPGSLCFFSPDSLESRYQSEILLPGSGVPVYKSGFKAKNSRLVEYLIQKGYWSRAAVTTPRWIMTGHFNPKWKDGQSHLHSELYWHDDEWIQWSEQNPDKAAALWPQVLAILRDDPQHKGQNEVAELMWQSK